MSYLPFARKYRPQTFDEIVGQEHIATTLKNAIAMDKVAHAYLFVGPRGVGKTTTARILAKSLNCEEGPRAEPCNKCSSCREILQGTGMDVIEIDGASNRGIDEIRYLRENVKFASVRGKFRIYIIDEVHMLTQEAFNALLKTLEEPPLHVKFIFATTRPYKVLPTIISRCQRFDFRRIPTRDIAKKLEEIKKKEKLDVNDEAIFLIARQADGSMRDAEIILDQLLSFTKGKVGAHDVTKALGLLEQDVLFDLADSIINNRKEKVLNTIDGLVNNGKDPIFIASSIIDYFRNLMVAKIAKDKSIAYITLSEEDYYRLQEQSKLLSLDEILYVTYTLSTAMDLMKKTSLSRVPLEISLIKLTDRTGLTSIKEVLDRLSVIEARVTASPFTPSPEPSPQRGEGQKEFPPPTGERVRESSPSTPRNDGIDSRFRGNDRSGLAPRNDKITPDNDKINGSPIPQEEVAAERDILLLQKIKNSWARVLNFIKNKKMSIATFLSAGKLLKVEDNVLAIGFEKNNSLHKEALEANVNKKFVEEAIKSIIGEDISLNIKALEGRIEEAAMSGITNIEESDIEEAEKNRPNRVDPIVESAIDIFDGRVIDIRENRNKERA
ncbi:MAG: DNA polymerase III subunit gamma/tau [Candidatus Omnitrophota bacterium]|nr:MAG: DNA polymerase III subunit gamma/tau [Candidatus Omnitrophota bacterium]